MGPYKELKFPTLDDRPYVVCNMVMTADGKATIAGVAHGIGDLHDHEAMQALRLHADATMSGAGTLVKEDITPFVDEEFQQLRQQVGKTKFPRAMTITDRADLPWDRKFFNPDYRPTIFFTGDDPGDIAKHAELVKVTKLTQALAYAKTELGVDMLVQEGGPTLNRSMMADGLIDELFVTLAPKISGQSGISIVEGQGLLNIQLKLISTAQINSELFLRYKLHKS